MRLPSFLRLDSIGGMRRAKWTKGARLDGSTMGEDIERKHHTDMIGMGFCWQGHRENA